MVVKIVIVLFRGLIDLFVILQAELLQISSMLCKRECKNATMYTDSTTQNDVLDSFLILTTGIGFTIPHATNDFPFLSGRTKIHQSPERNFSVLSSTG